VYKLIAVRIIKIFRILDFDISARGGSALGWDFRFWHFRFIYKIKKLKIILKNQQSSLERLLVGQFLALPCQEC